MSWFIYALLSAVFLSASSVIEKKSLQKVHSLELSSILAFINAIISIPFFFFIDWSKVNSYSTFLLFGTSLMAAGAFYLVAKAIKHLELSLVSPLLALSPGVTAVMAYLLLNEGLSKTDLFGISLMIVGSYILTLLPEHGFLYPLKTFKNSKYVHFIFTSLLLYSFSATLDRAIIFDLGVPVANFMFFVHFFIALLFIPAAYYFGHGISEIKKSFKVEGSNIVIISMLTILYRYFQVQAIALMYVGLVSAIKRTSSFFTTLIGGELFHEKNLKRKVFASAVIIVGAVIVVL